MSILIYLALLLIALLFIIILLLYFLLTMDSLLRVHDLPTSRRAIRTISKIIFERKAKAKNFYDLGCGRGTLALAIKKRFPRFQVFVIDKSSVRIFFAQLKALLLGQKIIFQKANLFDVDLKNVDIVYTYLWYDLMPPLEKKLQRELKPEALIITNTSNFPNWKPLKTYITYPKKPDFEKLFVYVKT